MKRSVWNGNTYGSTTQNAPSTRTGYAQTGSNAPKKSVTYGGIGSLPKAKPAAAVKDLSGFQIGVVVTHPKFGQGTIVGVKGAGANTIVDIAFKELGIKSLSASLAPLTIVR